MRKHYIVTNTVNLPSGQKVTTHFVRAKNRDEAQEKFIDAQEALGLVTGDLTIVRAFPE